MLRFWPLALALMLVCTVAVTASLLKNLGYSFTYQGSISMPEGFYWISPPTNLQRNDIVVFRPPPQTLAFLAQHPWAPKDGILMKVIMAIPGDFICKHDNAVWINHRFVAPVYRDYAPGKALPNTSFCEILPNKYYLLMSTHINRSFDGRYFGPVNEGRIVGRATKV